MTPLKIGAGIVGIVTLLTVAAIRSIPAPVEPIEVELSKGAPETTLKFVDRMPTMASTASEPVEQPARILPDVPAKAPPVILVEDGDKPTIRHRRLHMESDVCTKHGLRKVVAHGGRSWRCR